MKKIIVLVVVLLVTLTGCGDEEEHDKEIEGLNARIETLESKIESMSQTEQDLNQQIQDLKGKIEEKDQVIEKMKETRELFPHLSNLALEFVRGHTQGDIEKIKSVVSNDITIEEKDNKIYGSYTYDDNEIRYQLYDENREAIYQDKVIQGYGYLEGKNKYVIHIREFYESKSGQPLSPPTFLNLFFKKLEEGWKIVEFEFDV